MSQGVIFGLSFRCRATIKKLKKDNLNEKNLPLSLFSHEEPAQIEFVDSGQFNHLHEVILTAKYFKSIVPTDFEHERDEFIHKMMMQNKKAPVYLTLPKEERRIAIEALIDFLYQNIGRQQTNALMVGNLTLESIGLDKEFDKKLSMIREKNMVLSIFLCEIISCHF